MKDFFKLTLCQKNCCPTVEINTDSNSVVMKDDFGGKVSLTVEQFKILLDQYVKIKGEL